MEIGKYNALIIKACQRVRKNFHLLVSLNSNEYYGIHHWSHLPVYKLVLDFEGKKITIYPEEPAFESWSHVPWSGQDAFRPSDFTEWPEDKKLLLAWCGAIYKYCKSYNEYIDAKPPEID